MKALIALLLLMGGFWLVKTLYLAYQKAEKNPPPANAEQSSSSQPASAASAALPGLPASLETSLSAAQQRGATGLKDWLANYRIYVRDPRLAAIELDYVVLISHQDPAEARRIFKDIHDRTPTFSPIYERVKRLEKTFQ
jgi:hypothetical protein